MVICSSSPGPPRGNLRGMSCRESGSRESVDDGSRGVITLNTKNLHVLACVYVCQSEGGRERERERERER
jgi:hypothetical protein